MVNFGVHDPAMDFKAPFKVLVFDRSVRDGGNWTILMQDLLLNELHG